MALSPFYWSPGSYDFLMTMFLGPYQSLKYRWVSKLIGNNKSVLDFGCGHASLRKYLSSDVKYAGVELNKKFIHHCIKNKINVIVDNFLSSRNYGKWDCVTLIDIIHHIRTSYLKAIKKALRSANKKVIISDTVINPDFTYKIKELFWKVFDKDGTNPEALPFSFTEWDKIIKRIETRFNTKISVYKFNVPIWNMVIFLL